MKTLIYLMVLLSIFMGVPTNLGWFTLFGSEITGPFSKLAAGTYHVADFPNWILLLLSHIAVISLVFLVNRKDFKMYLIWLPLLFIILFTLYDLFALFLLVPFIIVWIISLIKVKKYSSKIVLSHTKINYKALLSFTLTAFSFIFI